MSYSKEEVKEMFEIKSELTVLIKKHFEQDPDDASEMLELLKWKEDKFVKEERYHLAEVFKLAHEEAVAIKTK